MLLASTPLLLASCLRTDTYDLDNTTPPPAPVPGNSGGAELAALYSRDSTLPAGSDTTYVQRFTYDAQGRISILTGTDKTPGGDSVHFEFSYPGNDTLAQRIIAYDRDAPPYAHEYNDTLYLRYEAGRLACDSMVSGSAGNGGSFSHWTRYVYNGNSVFFYHLYNPLTSLDTAVNGFLTAPVYANGSIVAEQDDSAVYNPQTGAIRRLNPFATFSATYDSHPNPVFRTGRAYQKPFTDIEYFIELATDGTIPRYLPLQTMQTSRNYPGGILKTENSYVFRTDGLPYSRTTRVFEQGAWGAWETMYYLYR